MRFSNRLGNSIITVLWMFALLAFICGCSLIPQIGHTSNRQPDPGVTPIVSSYQPARVLQVCFDTKPLMPDTLFRSAVSSVADMLDSSLNVNEGAIQVYISYITSHSYLNDAFSFSVPALGADQEPSLLPTPNPGKYNSPYDHANAVATVTHANATAVATSQDQWKQNHEKLAAARAQVKKYTNRLRSLPNVWDAAGEDIAGCLQEASERFQGFHGRKTLMIASPLVHMVSASNLINLSGATVEVIDWSCALASASDCASEKATWVHRLLSFGASHVSIHDPQQSVVEPPTF